MIFLYIALGILALILFFSLIPSVILYNRIFSRKRVSEFLSKRDLIGTRYEPYMDELVAAERYIKSLKIEQISVIARDGAVLCGEYVDNNSDKTVIFSHGFCGNPVSNFCLQAQDLYNQGFNLMFIIQRGHGVSGGKKIGLGALEQYDLLSWIELEAQKDSVKSILLYGSSMGSTAIAYASDKIKTEKVRAMVIDCAFSSPGKQLALESKRRHILPFLVMPWLRIFAKIELKEDIYRPAGRSLEKTKIPALFFHGTADKTVPIESDIENYNACASDKKLIKVDGAEHIIAYVTGGEKTKNELTRFINKYL